MVVVILLLLTTTSGLLVPALATTIEEDLANVLEDEDKTEELEEVLEDDSGAREDFFELLEEFDAIDDESVQTLADFIERRT